MPGFRARTVVTATLTVLAVGCSSQTQEEIARVPSQARAKAEQVEAQQLLKQVYTLQQTYYGTNRQYGRSLNEIGVVIPASARYRYALSATASAWSCEASANLDVDATLDRWSVDQSGRITCVGNDATS